MAEAGSTRNLSISGVSYRVFGDADPSEIPTKYTNSNLATSGNPVLKQEARTEDVSDFVIAVSKDELKTLKALSESGEFVPLAYEDSNGDIRKCTGQINIDTRTKMENRTTVMLLPQTDWS